MFTIRIPFTSLLLAALAVAQPALAQTRDRLNWPRTFGGQPDFEFTRDEVIKEAISKAARQGLPEPTTPTMADLLEDVTLTPLEDEVVVESPAATGVVSGTVGVAKTEKPELLPSLKPRDDLDLTEFRTTLIGALQQQVKNYEYDALRNDASYLLKGLKLETIVTSPLRYAIINGQRYKVGETITLPLALGPSDVEQLNLLDSLLPPEDSLSPDMYDQYLAVKETVVNQLAATKQANPMQYQKVFDLPVTLIDLAPRAVVVQFQGQKYELAIPYRY